MILFKPKTVVGGIMLRAKHAIFSIFLLLLTASLSIAQYQDTLWTRAYSGGEGYIWGFSIQPTADEGWIIAGRNGAFYRDEGHDAHMTRIDAEGNHEWTIEYGGDENDEAYQAFQLSDGGYVMAGYTRSFGAQDYNAYIIRTDSQGDTIWARALTDTVRTHANSILQTDDGGFIITGWIKLDTYYVMTARLDAEGNHLWTKSYGDWWCMGESIKPTSDGGFIISGAISCNDNGRQIYLVKIDETGTLLWSTVIRGSGLDTYAYDVVEAPDGGFVAVGKSILNYMDTQVCLTKVDGQGDSLWLQEYGNPLEDEGHCIQNHPDGGFILAGFSYTGSSRAHDGYLVKTDEDGEMEWSGLYGGDGTDQFYGVCVDAEGYLTVVGNTYSFGNNHTNLYVLSLTPGMTGISPIEKDEIPGSFAIQSIYPNPFNPETNVTINVPETGKLNLQLFNLQGQELFTANKQVQSGSYSCTLNGAAWPSGTYFLRATLNGSRRTTRKVILMK